MTTDPLTLLISTLLIALAAARLWRLAALDTITEPIHGRLRASTHPVAQWFGSLISCPWCLGFWINAALVWGIWWLAHPYTAIEAFVIMWAASWITGWLASDS